MNKITLLLMGVEKLKRGLKLGEEATLSRMQQAIRAGTQQVCHGATGRIHHVSGELASTIRDEYSKDGLIGYAKVGYGRLLRSSRAKTKQGRERLKRRRKGKLSGKGSYAPVVERGDPKRHHKAHPFMRASFEAARPTISANIESALHSGVTTMEHAI